MKTRLIYHSLAFCVLLTALIANAAPSKSRSASSPTKTPEKQPAEEPVERLSVFEEPTHPPYTDPFFPRTKRLPYRKEPEKIVESAQPQSSSIDHIILKGISLDSVGKRLALINNYTFAAGESGTVRVPRGTVNIEVLEVRERSAIIKVENDPQPKEIHLRSEP